MSEKTVLAPHIVAIPGVRGGRPHIEDKGVAVHHIAVCDRLGFRPDAIADDYDLTLAEVHAALAYYFDHQEEIDAWLEEDERFHEEMRRMHPSLIEQKLRALRA